MRVLVISNLYPPDVQGGYELGCRQMTEALRRRGHEARVLTSAPRTPVPFEPDVHRSLQLTDVWSPYFCRRQHDVTAWLRQSEALRVNAFNVHVLLNELQEFQPDVVYVWMIVGLGGLGLMGALEHLRVPWVWHLMDQVPLHLCRRGDEVDPTLAREVSRRLRGTYLACSQQLLDYQARDGLTVDGEIEIVPNWIAGEFGPPRTTYLEDGTLRIVGAASFIDRTAPKGIDVLVEAAAHLRDMGHENFRADIYGRTTDGWIPELIQRHDVSRFVRLQGLRTQREMAAIFGEYDLFAFPTHVREPFAFVALEAAAMGCVPVMSQVCGNAEWMVAGVHTLKAPRDAEAFARVFAGVIEGRVDLEGIGRRVARAVREDFHIDSIMPRVERALSAAASRSRLGGASPEEAYQLAILAQRLESVLVQERHCA